MKTLIVIILLFSFSSFASSKNSETKKHDRLNTEIVKRVGDVAFDIEVMFPDYDTASYIAYKECGEKEFDQFIPDTQIGEDIELVPVGYSKKTYYSEAGKDSLVYKCKDGSNDKRRTSKVSAR